MANPGFPTLDQLRIFLAVVDEGSFNGAARKLNRAVSVISYGIANLEAQLGVSLFEREGSKKPKLTEAGQAVLSEASLSFLGFGDPQMVSWGQMLYAAYISGSIRHAWWSVVPPGLCITVFTASVFLIGREYERVVNPRLDRG